MTDRPRSPVAPWVAVAAFLLVGLPLAFLGASLVAAGGSVMPMACGLGLVAVGVLLARRHASAPGVLAAILAVMLAWSLWEVGLATWGLVARLDVLAVLALVLLLPAVNRGLVPPGAAPRRGGRIALGVALAVVVATLLLATQRDPSDLAGRLPRADATAGIEVGADGPDAAGMPARGVAGAPVPAADWVAYGRTAGGQRYSPLSQIRRANVHDLQVAWTYHTGDLRGRPGDPVETTDEVTPLKVGDSLFLCTPHQLVIALDATTGRERWRFDAQVAIDRQLALQHLTCRGLAYHPGVSALPATTAGPSSRGAVPATSSDAPPASAPAPASAASPAASSRATAVTSPPRAVAATTPGARRRDDCTAQLFMPTADARLIALDPATGAVCTRFGGGTGQVDLAAHMPHRMPGSAYSTSPPVVTRHLVIVGGTVLDNYSTHEESGVIRAYDVTTGALVWNFDAGRPDDTAPITGDRTYTANSPNSWSISSVDEALGLVYVPMGNQPPDQFGGHRSEPVERLSSSVVALDLATGRIRWVFQTVHHDLWDYDVPAQPTLVDLDIGGSRLPALVQPTKQGELFVLDRRTGRPLLPVAEWPAPAGAAEGDHASPTQPVSRLSLAPPALREADLWGGTLLDQTWCRLSYRRLRYEGRFTPPSTRGTLVYPGNFGVFNWGGIAVDPVRQVAFAMPTYLAFTSRLIPRTDETSLLVQPHGSPPHGVLPALNENFGAPYAAKMGAFLSPFGLPCQAPPWGQVAGIDLRTGTIAWRHRNGSVRELSPLRLPFEMGVPGLGGPLLTAGGVAFLSGTLDDTVRAYDVDDGRVLWQARLPAGGQATPMTYADARGRQIVLVVAGGHGSTGTRAGDAVIAYALPGR